MNDFKLRPEILAHSNIPKPLHGLSPRTINGDTWWNATRQEVYARYNYHCIACGTHKLRAKGPLWLEAHEYYEIDYVKGTMVCKSIEPLCHYCHNFIHSGRLQAIIGIEKSQKEIVHILEHGFEILARAKLKCFPDTLIFAEQIGARDFGVKGYVVKSSVPWSKWRLIWNGKEYYSKFKNIEELEAYYQTQNRGGSMPLERKPVPSRPVAPARSTIVSTIISENSKSKPVLVIGKSGSGKSTAMRNLDPRSTYLFNVMGKDLPFKGWRKKYEEGKNMLCSTDYEAIEKEMDLIKKRKEVKTVIIDDFQYLMADEFMRRGMEKGYDKFTEIGLHAYSLIRKAGTLGTGRCVYFLAHSDTNEFGEDKVKTIGKLLDDKICVEGMFTIVLNCVVDKGNYYFATRNTGKNTTKSPDGMFKEIFIPNDLAAVSKAIYTYENE